MKRKSYIKFRKSAHKFFCSILSGMFIFSAFVFVGCNSEKECEHKFNHYVVLAPTCTQKGILESLCEKCGEKQYSDLTPSGHDFVNGVCTICSQEYEEPAPTPTPLDKEVGWTIEKIYERFYKSSSIPSLILSVCSKAVS